MKIDMPTRWNSTFIMLQSIKENFDHITTILVKDNKQRRLLDIDKRKLSQLTDFLTPFYKATLQFCSPQWTLADVWPTVVAFTDFLNSRNFGMDIESDEDGSFADLEQMKLNMLDGLTSLVGRRHLRLSVTPIHQCATVFDPRLRHLPFADGKLKQDVYEKIYGEMATLSTKRRRKEETGRSSITRKDLRTVE